MSYKKHACMLAPILMLAGCFASLHPLYQKTDLVALPELEGLWADDDSLWSFEPAGEFEYRLTYIEEDCPAHFRVRVLELDGMLFWDLFPEGVDTSNDFYELHLVPAHTFALLDLQGDRLQVGFLGDEWLKAKLESEPDSLPHEELEDGVVLTASTARLQDFVRQYAPDAFDQTMELTRLRD